MAGWVTVAFFFWKSSSSHATSESCDNTIPSLRQYRNLFQVLYSVRLSLTNSCSMQLQMYPLDVQVCNFDLISYAHTTKVEINSCSLLFHAPSLPLVSRQSEKHTTKVEIIPLVSYQCPRFLRCGSA